MAGGVQGFYPDRPQFKHLAIGGLMHGVGGVGLGAVNDGSSRFLGQIDVPRHKIGVEMGLENVLDGSPPFFGHTDVGGCFAEGVNDGRLAVAFNVIGSLRQAAGI